MAVGEDTAGRPRVSGKMVGMTGEDDIREIVDRETRAWSTQDVELLLSVFHPDMVWPWPPNENAYDPLNWTWGMGRFDAVRWSSVYAELFARYELVHNRRQLLRASRPRRATGRLRSWMWTPYGRAGPTAVPSTGRAAPARSTPASGPSGR